MTSKQTKDYADISLIGQNLMGRRSARITQALLLMCGLNLLVERFHSSLNICSLNKP